MIYTFVCNEFDPERILFCGQAFRWKKEGEIYSGIASGHFLTLSVKENEVTFHDINEDEKDFWLNYFDIQTDYAALVNTFSADESMKKACGMCKGIRVLRQDPFEVLISFIISQNNNIKRITGIIERLCEYYGEPTEHGYMFPNKEALYDVAPDDLALLRAGFRAKYIAHAMELIKSGEIDLDSIYDMDIDTAREYLKKIKGVGDKVADCVLLFGYHKTEAFPKDVWIKRVMRELYPSGLPQCIKGYEGIAQQYLFDYARNINLGKE